MGCDIHAFVEVQETGGWWRSAATLELNRWYRAFAELGGVRLDREWPHKTWRRGVPADVGSTARSAAADYAEDGHAHSWATLEEIRELASNPEIDTYDYFNGIASAMSGIAMGRPVRLVFFFDN